MFWPHSRVHARRSLPAELLGFISLLGCGGEGPSDPADGQETGDPGQAACDALTVDAIDDDDFTWLRWRYLFHDRILVTEEIDLLADDVVEGLLTFTYDGAGRLSMESADVPADGTLDSTTTHSYDGTGALANSDTDFLDPGIPDVRASYALDVDESGNPVRITEYDAGPDGTVDSRRTETYDASGNVVRSETDSDLDGEADGVTVYVYDDSGRLATSEYSREEADQDEIHSSYRYAYDGCADLTIGIPTL